MVAVDMTELVKETYGDTASQEAQQNIIITFPQLPEVRGDKILLRQVWSNLLSNAIKFTLAKHERSIIIGGRSEENRNIYFVKDSGAGFDMKDAGKLFGVFSRLHSDEEFEGTGIGLSIVRRVIHRHKGEVWAEGEVGKGATFYFSLPRT